MNKFKALTIFAKSFIRNMQGSGELLNFKHIFYEACRAIKRNKWEDEAYEFLTEELNSIQGKFDSLKREYMDYMAAGVKDDKKEEYFKRKFHKLGVDGRNEEIIKYAASHGGKDPSLEKLNEILQERKAQDERNALIFLECQRSIYNGTPFDQNQLMLATSKLIEHGLYRIVINLTPAYINCYNSEDLIEGYSSGFNLYLY